MNFGNYIIMCVCMRACACGCVQLVTHVMFLTFNDPKYVLLYFRVLPFLFSSGLVALKTANVVFKCEAFPEV